MLRVDEDLIERSGNHEAEKFISVQFTSARCERSVIVKIIYLIYFYCFFRLTKAVTSFLCCAVKRGARVINIPPTLREKHIYKF